VARAVDDRRGIAEALFNLTHTQFLVAGNDLTVIEPLRAEAGSIYAELGDDLALARLEFTKAYTVSFQGGNDEARAMIAETLRTFEREGDEFYIALAGTALGGIALMERDVPTAIRIGLRGLVRLRQRPAAPGGRGLDLGALVEAVARPGGAGRSAPLGLRVEVLVGRGQHVRWFETAAASGRRGVAPRVRFGPGPPRGLRQVVRAAVRRRAPGRLRQLVRPARGLGAPGLGGTGITRVDTARRGPGRRRRCRSRFAQASAPALTLRWLLVVHRSPSRARCAAAASIQACRISTAAA